MRGHVVVFAYHYLPANTSGVQRARRMNKFLPEAGYDTTVITTSKPGRVDDDLTGIWAPDATSTPAAHRRSSLLRHLQRLMPYNDRLPWIPYAVESAVRLHQRKPATALISTAPPIATHLAAWRAKKFLGVPWVADFRDPVFGNPSRNRRWARAYDQWLEKVVVRNADAIVMVTDVVADDWKQRYPDAAHKIHVIWNGFDPDDNVPSISTHVNGPRVLTHAGYLYTMRFPWALIESMDRLAASGQISAKTAQLHLIGPMEGFDHVMSQPSIKRLVAAGCLNIDGKQVPREVAIRRTAESDYLLLIDIVNLDRVGYTVPAKIFDYVLTGRPILAMTDAGSPVDRILEKSGVPVATVYHADSSDCIDAKVLQLFSMDSSPVRASTWFYETFDGRRQMGGMAKLLDELTARQS